MKNILFITHLFPPYGGSSVQRSSKFTKYLKHFGYNPIVLTTKVEEKKVLGNDYTFYNMDWSLLDDLKSIDLQVIRTKSSEPGMFFNILDKLHLNRLRKFIFIPDPLIFWIIPAIRAGLKIIRNNRIKLIYTSAPPYSVNITGLILSRISKLPWVADFRDPWTQNFIEYWATKIHYLIEKNIEQKVYKTANRIIVCTPMCKEQLVEKNNNINPSKIETITHAYDAEDFTEGRKNEYGKKKFILTYIGRFYRGYNSATRRRLVDFLSLGFLTYRPFPLELNSATPYYFMKALHELLKKYPLLKNDIEVKFVGPLDKKNSALIERFSLEDIVSVTGYIDHSECINIMLESSLLLYIIGYSRESSYHMAAKLYEYMASKIPILALVSEGDSKKCLKNSGLAFFANPVDSDEISKQIYLLYQQWKSGGITVHPNDRFISQFERKKLARKLADVFNEVLR
ncbi:MAG: glycosyltransferase [Planctomycetota bacterium]|jgi:hypothetical protein